MATVPATKDEVIAAVKRRLAPGVLAAGSITKELNPLDYDYAWAYAVNEFTALTGQLKEYSLTLTGVGTYALPSDCDRVFDVIPPGSPTDIAVGNGIPTGFGFEDTGFPADTLYGTHDPFPLTNLEVMGQSAEMWRKAVGKDFRWEFLEFTRQIRVHPPDLTGLCVIQYALNEIDFSKLPVRLRLIIQELCYADASERLGIIRRKYADGVPGAAGNVMLDGDARVLEAQTIKETQLDILRKLYPAAGGMG